MGKFVMSPYRGLECTIFESTQRWVAERNIFEDGLEGRKDYACSVAAAAD